MRNKNVNHANYVKGFARTVQQGATLWAGMKGAYALGSEIYGAARAAAPLIAAVL
jgi:hypothetical protein